MEMGKSYQAVSVDQPIEIGSEGSTVPTHDILGFRDPGFEKVDKKLLIESSLTVLTERELAILHCTFIENKTQKETGEFLGISQMHISRLQKKALKKLRRALSK